MKKRLIGVVLALGVFAFASTAFAHGNEGFSPNGEANENQAWFNFNFEEMLPFMQQVHPNWSNDDLETMYNDCHGSQGQVGYQGNMPNGMGGNSNFNPQGQVGPSSMMQ